MCECDAAKLHLENESTHNELGKFGSFRRHQIQDLSIQNKMKHLNDHQMNRIIRVQPVQPVGLLLETYVKIFLLDEMNASRGSNQNNCLAVEGHHAAV